MYILRTMDPTEHEEEWKNYDEITRNPAGAHLPLPVGDGGFANEYGGRAHEGRGGSRRGGLRRLRPGVS